MRSGRQRWRVTVESPVYPDGTPTGQGNLPERHDPLGIYWMAVKTLAGREQVNADQTVATSSHVFTVRYLPSDTPGVPLIRPEHRLNFKGRIFNIDFINNVDERNRQLDVFCTEDARP